MARSPSPRRKPFTPGRGQVQIAVAYTGLCGTDLHILHGSMDARVQTPLVFGHEMSGTIAALGEGVSGWSVGDGVTVMPLVVGRHVSGVPRRQHPHLPEPRLHRHRLARVAAGAVERPRRNPRRPAAGAPSRSRGSRRTGRRRRPRRAPFAADSRAEGRRHRRRPDRSADRDPSPATSAATSS